MDIGPFRRERETLAEAVDAIDLCGRPRSHVENELKHAIWEKKLNVFFRGVPEMTKREWLSIDWNSIDIINSTIRYKPERKPGWNNLPLGVGTAWPVEIRRADRERLWPTVTRQRGRPATVDWDAFGLALESEVNAKGVPAPDGDLGWRTQADVERWAAGWIEKRDETASEATIRRHVRERLKKLA